MKISANLFLFWTMIDINILRNELKFFVKVAQRIKIFVKVQNRKTIKKDYVV